MEHRTIPESSAPVENTTLVLAGAGFHFITEQIFSGRVRREVTPFDSDTLGGELGQRLTADLKRDASIPFSKRHPHGNESSGDQRRQSDYP